MSRRAMIVDSDSESETPVTTRNNSGTVTPSTAGTSVLGTSSKMTQNQDGMEIDGNDDEDNDDTLNELDSDDDEPLKPAGRTTPRRQAATLASTKLKLPPLDFSSDLSDVEMSPVKPSNVKGKEKGKETMIVLSSDSENDEGLEDDSELENLSDRDGARKARTLAKALRSVTSSSGGLGKGKGKIPDTKEVGKSITRMLKGKGKASSTSDSGSAIRSSARKPPPNFEVVVLQKRFSNTGSVTSSPVKKSKVKSKLKVAKEVVIISSDSADSNYDSDTVSSTDGDSDSDSQAEEVKPRVGVESNDEEEVEDDMFKIVSPEEAQRQKKEKAEALEKMGKKPKVAIREGAKISAETKLEMKKMTKAQQNVVKLNANHSELVDCWEDLAALPVIKPVLIEQPAGLTRKLLPFQQEGLDFMVKSEKSPWKGGILADEPGMGKTIQTIALLLTDYKKGSGKCTLVLAPTVAIVQWKNEIEKFTTGFKVLIFHGSNRIDNAKEMEKYDVVLTSYAVMESGFRRQQKGFSKKGVLMKEDSILQLVKWHRIILDEAHYIKDRGSNTAKAAFALTGKYRWLLSGTPLQNRVGELYSLLRFLGSDPFAFYYCKGCSCKSLHWLCNRGPCTACGHSGMQHICYWNDQILKPIQYGGHSETGIAAFGKLQTLLNQIMLRRTKVEREDDMGIPPRVLNVRRDYFNEEEEELYQSLFKDVKRKFNTYAEQGTVLMNYSNIFTLITRMRQMADHPDLVLKSRTAAPVAHTAADAPQEILTCRICFDEAEDPIMSACRHIFCRACVVMYLESSSEEKPGCSVCNTPLTIDLDQEALEQDTSGRQGILSRIDPSKMQTSTKIEALVEELSKLKTEDSTLKSLVFSQFTTMLDLIARRLQLGGFKIVRLQGTMSPAARDATVQRFTNDPDITVFLISLKAGGVALNLTEASRVFIVDPWWNPAVECQAYSRIHRIGQTRPVVVTRLIIENSIESRIVELQKKKEHLAESALGDSVDSMGKLSPEDLMFLFQL